MHKLNKKGFGVIELILVVVLVGVVGYVGWSVFNSDDTSQQASITDEEALALPEDLNSLKSFDEIMQLATESGDKVAAVSLETEDGLLVYKVWLENGSLMYVDAVLGETIDVENEVESASEDAIPEGFEATTSVDNALNAARAEHPNVSVKKIEMEVQDGSVVFRIEFVDEVKVDVDALSGSVVLIETPDIDTDDDLDNDGIKNEMDNDIDNDGIENEMDNDDDNDGVNDDQDDDDDNDGVKDEDETDENETDDEDHDEIEDSESVN